MKIEREKGGDVSYATSSMAADERATTPTFERVRSWLVRMRASTGKAVIDTATPTNSMNVTNVADLACRRSQSAAPNLKLLGEEEQVTMGSSW
jgi:hypothetical protein